MDTIADLLNNNKTLLLKSLKYSGFNQAQAEQFLPEAGKIIVNYFLIGYLDIASILDKINFSALAKNTGIEASLTIAGVTTLIPTLREKFRDHCQVKTIGEGSRILSSH